MSRPPSERMRKVNEALREVLATGIESLGDPGIGFVTVTGVQADLRPHRGRGLRERAGQREEARALAGSLERATGVLQGQVARELKFRRTPLLTFHYDETLDRALANE